MAFPVFYSLIYKWFKGEIDELCNQSEEGGRVMCAQEIGRKMFLRGMDFETVEDLTGLMEGEVEYLQQDVQNSCLGS